MPSVLRIRGYHFFFYSSDRTEPPHIHVEKNKSTSKIWLNPVRLGESHGFSSSEINEIIRIVEENQEILLRGWDEYFEN